MVPIKAFKENLCPQQFELIRNNLVNTLEISNLKDYSVIF